MTSDFLQSAMQIISVISALIVFCHGVLFVINRMTSCTNHGIRWAWLALTTGALGVLLAPLYGIMHATKTGTIILVGVALFTLCDRRCLTDCPLDKALP